MRMVGFCLGIISSSRAVLYFGVGYVSTLTLTTSDGGIAFRDLAVVPNGTTHLFV